MTAPTLVEIDGTTGAVVLVTGARQPVRDEVVIGRSRSTDLQLHQDGLVSRRHCRIQRSSVGWIIHDLDSRHGVFVDGERVTSRLLTGGEIIRLGRTFLRLDR